MNPRKFQSLKSCLQLFVEDALAGIGLSERTYCCTTYLRGVLLDGERESIEPMASRLPAIDEPTKGYVQAIQQFVNQSNRKSRSFAAKCGNGSDSSTTLPLESRNNLHNIS